MYMLLHNMNTIYTYAPPKLYLCTYLNSNINPKLIANNDFNVRLTKWAFSFFRLLSWSNTLAFLFGFWNGKTYLSLLFYFEYFDTFLNIVLCYWTIKRVRSWRCQSSGMHCYVLPYMEHTETCDFVNFARSQVKWKNLGVVSNKFIYISFQLPVLFFQTLLVVFYLLDVRLHVKFVSLQLGNSVFQLSTFPYNFSQLFCFFLILRQSIHFLFKSKQTASCGSTSIVAPCRPCRGWDFPWCRPCQTIPPTRCGYWCRWAL